MAYWKMGVGLPLLNNSFGWGTRVYAKCNPPSILTPQGFQGQYTSLGTSSFYYNEDYGNDIGLTGRLTKFLRPGDRIRVGPSSYPGYEGAFQDFEVNNVNTTFIGCTTGTNVIFTVGDPIIGVGTNCPGGWIPVEQGTLTMGGITNHSLVQLATSPGYIDRYSVQFQGSGAGSNGVRWNFNLDEYVPNTYYRIGYWYQLTTPSGSGFLASQLVTTGSELSTNNTTTDVAVWTELNGAVGGQSPSVPGAAFYLQVYTSGTSGGGSVIPNVDHIYVEHATQTDDESLGVYTFDDYPALGSRKFKTISPSKHLRLSNRRLVRNSVGNDTYKRYTVSAGFKDVSTTLRDNLEVFLDWQDLGKPLVLHHDIPSVPPNLYGTMTVQDTSMGHWSGGVCSFTINFEEI